MEISLLLLQLAHLRPQLLCDFDASRHLFLRAGLISVEVIKPGFGGRQAGQEVVVFDGEGGDGLVLVLKLYPELGEMRMEETERRENMPVPFVRSRA